MNICKPFKVNLLTFTRVFEIRRQQLKILVCFRRPLSELDPNPLVTHPTQNHLARLYLVGPLGSAAS